MNNKPCPVCTIKKAVANIVRPLPVVPICRGCGMSAQFVWHFNTDHPTKTCRDCGFVDDAITDKRKAA